MNNKEQRKNMKQYFPQIQTKKITATRDQRSLIKAG